MKNTKLAGRYAKALHTFSLEQNIEEEVYHDMLLLQKTLQENHELKVVIESPVIVAQKKKNILLALFENKLSKIALDFLVLIVTQRREPELLSICEQFVSCYYVQHNIRKAKVTTAVALNETLLADIKNLLEEQTKSTILLEQVVNPKIIGGLIVKVDDFLFDASLLGKINKLKAEFSQNLYQTNF